MNRQFHVAEISGNPERMLNMWCAASESMRALADVAICISEGQDEEETRKAAARLAATLHDFALSIDLALTERARMMR